MPMWNLILFSNDSSVCITSFEVYLFFSMFFDTKATLIITTSLNFLEMK